VDIKVEKEGWREERREVRRKIEGVEKRERGGERGN